MVDEERILKLKLLLKDLFQFEDNDLDFGIYRIINIKRKEISEFIDVELFDIIKENIKNIDDSSELQKNLELLKKEIESTFGCDIDNAKRKYAETPKVIDYLEKEKEITKINKENDIEEEIYDDIINFFSRYYDKGDFISKRRYSKDSRYAIPYNGEEVYLYWANNDQYYIKTAENFKNYSFKVGSIKVDFEVLNEEVDVEKGNIKDAENKFFILIDVEYDIKLKYLIVKFGYRGLTAEEEIAVSKLTDKKKIGKDEVNAYNLQQINENIAIFGLSDLQKKHIKMDGNKSDKSELAWHLNKYTTKNTSDYFIHKDLKKFFTQELDFYVKNEILHIDDIDSKEDFDINLNKIKVFKQISLKMIEFLAQVEDFQKKLWEKKKFVISTDYCITLDYIDEKYYPEILSNEKQLEEWRKLYSFDFDVEINKLKGHLAGAGKNQNELKIEFFKQNPTLAIDTKFYDLRFKYQILCEIDNLDEKTTGILINSDNFHALNLLLNKYEKKIKCCYIDPPYNTDGDGFLYKDGFKHSSWLSLVENRLVLSHKLLHQEARFYCSIDDRESSNLLLLLYKLFGRENYLGAITWEKRTKSQNTETSKLMLQSKIEYIHPFSVSSKRQEFNLEVTGEKDYPEKDENGPFRYHYVEQMSSADVRGRKTMIYPILGVLPREGMQWKVGTEYISNMIQNNQLILKEGKPCLKIRPQNEDQVIYKPFWSHFFDKEIYGTAEKGLKLLDKEMGFGKTFSTVKPVELIAKLLFHSTDKNQTVLDFFAGSGTTGHAVLNLNKEDGGTRKLILVEMGQYFDTVTKPRILKVIYSNNWKGGKPQDNDGSPKQIIKYQSLEQYEDSLNNIDFKEPTTLAKESKDYKIKYMLEFESKESNVLLNLDALDNPFEYKLRVYDNNEFKLQNVDLIETFNYIAGIDVKSIQRRQDDTVTYVVVKGNRNGKDVIVIWRNRTDNFEPEKDKEFIEIEILNEEYDEILVNGNSLVENAKSIDEIFKSSMFRG